MAKKVRKPWQKRLVGVVMATILAVQPTALSWNTLGMAYAAENDEILTELVSNGDFSEISADGTSAANWNINVTGSTSVRYEAGKAIFNIQELGDLDWSNFLKYAGIQLKNGQTYVISFTVKSSVTRTIQYGFDGPRMGIEQSTLLAEKEQNISYEMVAQQDVENNPFMFYLGTIPDGVNPTEEHTVEISNFSIKGTAETDEGDDNGNTGNTDSEERDTADGEPVTAVEGNLLTNGNFENKQDGWNVYSEQAVVSWNKYRTVFQIQQDAVDWAQSMHQTVSLEAGANYQVKFDIESSIERTIRTTFENSGDEIHSTTIPANEKTTVSYTTDKTGTGNYEFFLYLGALPQGIADTSAYQLGPHKVVISNVSVIKLADGSGGSGEGSGGNGENTDADTEDGAEVPEVAGNLLKNGNFALKNDTENWQYYDTNADIYRNQYRTVFQIKGDAADWQQAIYQNVDLEAGTEYTVSFDIESSVERSVAAGFDNSGRDEFHSEIIPANEKTTLSYTTTNAKEGSNQFMIYLGTNVGAHKVVISNVSIVENPKKFDTNDENDSILETLNSIQGLNPSEYYLLKDGTFTAGMSNWEHWEEDWMKQYNVVKYTPVDNGVNVYIKNTGGGEGNKPWDVQLNQHLNIKAGLQYTISFDLHTEKARAINVVVNDADGNAILSKTIGLQKNESRHVSFNIPVQDEDRLQALFSIQMGNVSGDVQDNNLLFTNMKIEVNGFESLAALIEDGSFTDGFGSFTTAAPEGNRISAENQSIIADLTTATEIGEVTLTKSGLLLEEGVTYQLSFVAGAVSGNREVQVVLPDGTNKKFTLTDEPTLYTAEITPNETITAGELTFLLGGTADTICLDTVRLDAKGFAEAAGLKLDAHDIVRLTKNVAPVISEDPNGVAGRNIELTFVDATGEYTNAINGVKINGTVVPEDKYSIEQGKIIVDSSLFAVTGDKTVFHIEVTADWYTPNEAIQIIYAAQQWNLTWEDEFNEDTLDTTKWSYQDGTGAEYGLDGWGNNEQQYYTKDNLTLGDGTMTITATKGTHSKAYDSARIWSMNDDKKTAKFAQTYGRFEAKMKLPAGDGCQGLWPAFWLLPVDSVYGGWPLSGEIDIMEARGREGDRADGTIHFGKPWPNDGSAGSSMVWDDPLAITDYHIYSVDWTPTYMSFQVDGYEYYRAENWYSEDPDNPVKYAFPAPFDQDFYIVFNMAVGGTYDGNLIPSEDVLPAEMKVDYVRVYESAAPIEDSYIAPDPSVEAETVPSDAKTSIIDPDFTDVKTVVNDNDEKNINGWNLLTLASFGGAATFSKEGEFAKINITNGGGQTYSVQLTQKLSLYKGNWYTLSFDAKADKAKEIIAKIGGDGTNSWSAYNSVTTKLTKDVKHYEYTFQMLNDSDDCSRLELNLGGGGTGTVYIANVEFKQAEGLTINHDMIKAPLENGNHIYNGNFDLGDVSRLAYWHASTGTVVKEGKEYFFRSTGASTLSQTGVELLQNDSYQLTFDGKANTSTNVTVTFTGEDGSVYYEETVTLDTIKSNPTITFTVTDTTTQNATVTFTFADGSIIDIDNIELIRTTYNNVDYTGLNCYPLPNGDFELDDMGWTTSGTTLTIANENGSKTGRVEGKTTANRWDALLSYGNLDLNGGYAYEFSFDAKADKTVSIDVTLEDSSYNRLFAQTNIEIETEWKTYTYTLKFTSDANNLALKFLTGGAKEAYNLDLDNVVLKMKGAPAEPGSFQPRAYNRIGEDVVITHSGSSEWANLAKLKIDGNEIDSNFITFNGSELILDKSLFTESRIYTVSATAEGYADSKAVSFRLYPENGDRICNGDLNFGEVAWETYIHGGNSAELNYDKPYLSARYLHAEGDEWGNPSVPWSIQFNQTVTIDQAGKYELSFIACSEIERYIMVGFNGQTEKVKLTETPTLHTVTLNADSTGTYQVVFTLGTVDPEVENGYFPKEGFVDFAPHNFYLDSISLLPEGSVLDKNSELMQPENENKYDIEMYKKTGTYPTKEGKVFAGWYTSDTEFTLETALPKEATTGEAYAKFVDENVLHIMWQMTNGTTAESAKTNLRFVTSVDSLNYKRVGFKITFNGKTIKTWTNTVYKGLINHTEEGDSLYSPSIFSEESNYFMTYILNNVPKSAFDSTFEVTPIWETLDGTEVEGITSYFKISDAWN